MFESDEWEFDHAEQNDALHGSLQAWLFLVAVLFDFEFDVGEFVGVAEYVAVDVGSLNGESPFEQKLKEVVSSAALALDLAQPTLVLLYHENWLLALRTQIKDQQLVLRRHFYYVGDCAVQLYLVAQSQNLQLHHHRLQIFVSSPKTGVVDYLLALNDQVNLQQLDGSFSVELVVDYFGCCFVDFEVTVLAELNCQVFSVNSEQHKDVVGESGVLYVLECEYVFLVGFDVVLVPLEGSADLVDVVLEFAEDGAHGFLWGSLHDVDESIDFFFEDDEVAFVAD